MKKEEAVLTQREILVLARCELIHRCSEAERIYSIYSDFVSRGMEDYLPCLESAHQNYIDLLYEFDYVDTLLYQTSDCG